VVVCAITAVGRGSTVAKVTGPADTRAIVTRRRQRAKEPDLNPRVEKPAISTRESTGTPMCEAPPETTMLP
jgi:hypothetical protein